MPPGKRDAAIRLAMAAWTPYPETSHYVMPHGDGAWLCAWNARDVGERLAELGLMPAQVSVVPEAAFRILRPSSPEREFLLEAALEGVCGVVVSAGRTVAEQWWPETPALTHWRNFLRGAGIDVTNLDQIPFIDDRGWRTSPIGYPAEARSTQTSGAELLAVWVAAVILAVPTVWLANELRQVESYKNAASERLAATEKDLDAVLNSREAALGAQDRATKLAGLVNPPDHIQLFTIINDVLGQNKGQSTLQLSDWEIRGRSLKFTVVASNGLPPPATTLVKAFEKADTFRDVEARLDGTRISVSLRIASTGSAVAVGNPPAGPGTSVAGAKS